MKHLKEKHLIESIIDLHLNKNKDSKRPNVLVNNIRSFIINGFVYLIDILDKHHKVPSDVHQSQSLLLFQLMIRFHQVVGNENRPLYHIMYKLCDNGLSYYNQIDLTHRHT